MREVLPTKFLASAFLAVAVSLLLGPSCSESSEPAERVEPSSPPEQPRPEPNDEVVEEENDDVAADVTAVRASGSPGSYTFAVTLSSPDTGCEQYADWWEVVTRDGALLYRRILAHSHVNEQPFTRSGGPVEIQATTRVVVRGHMNEAGYGGVAYTGSPESGFAPDPSVASDFAVDVADENPQPSGCAF